MLALAFFAWWYGRGWAMVASNLGQRLRAVSEAFSVRLLARTLFAPWRRIITPPGASLGDRWRAMGDNLVSRAVGFVVRLFVLLGALVTTVLIAAFGIVELAIWPLLPPAVPVLVVMGILR